MVLNELVMVEMKLSQRNSILLQLIRELVTGLILQFQVYAEIKNVNKYALSIVKVSRGLILHLNVEYVATDFWRCSSWPERIFLVMLKIKLYQLKKKCLEEFTALQLHFELFSYVDPELKLQTQNLIRPKMPLLLNLMTSTKFMKTWKRK